MEKILILTKKLVTIPSWVDSQTNEIIIGEFIFNYLKQNTSLKVQKEMVSAGRFNILAQNSQKIDTLIIGHTDTVGIDKNTAFDPLKPFIKRGRLYGRGTTDMKSGLAAMMLLAKSNNLPPNTGFLFYVDEEYSFLGMKKFINDFRGKIKPNKIISLDGSELEIGNGCRGLIEIEFEVKGRSCHAATPENGVSAIDAGFRIVEKLKTYLAGFTNPELGTTTLNLGLISGGSAPNLVAGSCRLTLDIRPGNSQLNASLVIKKLQEFASSESVLITDLRTNYDFTSWLTPKSKLAAVRLPFKNIRNSGYIDIQLLWKAFNKPLCLTIGAGVQSAAHTPDEYIEVDKIKRLPQILDDILKAVV